jgi:hypothetical protein
LGDERRNTAEQADCQEVVDLLDESMGRLVEFDLVRGRFPACAARMPGTKPSFLHRQDPEIFGSDASSRQRMLIKIAERMVKAVDVA